MEFDLYDRFVEQVKANPEVGLRIIRTVARTYKDDSRMIDFTFFREQASFAIYASDVLRERKDLSPADRGNIDYINKEIRPHFVR
jgi:hypothetical protein